MDTNTVAPANANNARREPGLDYGWTLVAILAATVLAWVARKVFWQKDSN